MQCPDLETEIVSAFPLVCLCHGPDCTVRSGCRTVIVVTAAAEAGSRYPQARMMRPAVAFA